MRMVYSRPKIRIRIATQIRGSSFPSPYSTLALGSHFIKVMLFGYFRITNEKDTMKVCRSLVYESRLRVARVATGFFFPIRFENFEEQELIQIITMTRTMMYRGKASWSQVLE